MCGICGWFNADNKIDMDTVVRMNNTVRYRGPDDEGYALIARQGIVSLAGKDSHITGLPEITAYQSDRNVFLAFGHRRLSIIDLSESGHQPMVSPEGTLCIVFNGELYNYIEIKKELKRRGHTFASSSDTEVVLCAYREWGENCVNHFNGMWAFAIWDYENKKLFCSRDRLGAKPFYYYMDEHHFIFASEMKQLCANPIVPRIMNDENAVTQIVWGITDFNDQSLIKDIKVLRGGYNLSLSCGETGIKGFHINQYWDIQTHCGKTDDAEEKALSIFEDAVKIRMRSDVPVGLLLSGGLDSSSLAAVVSEYMKENGRSASEISTFTSCYQNFAEGDERKYAELVNEYCGTTQNLIYPDEQDTFDLYEKMIWHTEGQMGLSALGSFMTLREISKNGIKVLLNGQGSDETMFGYERYYSWYLKDILKEKGIKEFLGNFNYAVKNSRLSGIHLFWYLIYFNSERIRRTYCLLRTKKGLTKEAVRMFKQNDSVKQNLFFDNMADMQYNEIRGTQLTHILRGDDRSYMAFSMESRVPFIDYRYIEQAVQIPEKKKIQNGYTKYPLRKHMEGRLPGQVVWRRNKMGWPSPRKRWIDRFDNEKMEDLFQNTRSVKYFNVDKIKSLYHNHADHYIVEKFLNVELFMRLFDVNTI